MLMCDGLCTLGIKLWAQTVTVNPGTTYYFIFWYTSIINNSPAGSLRIDINGVESGSVSIPAFPAWNPATVTWTAPVGVTTALVSIENTQTTGCNSAVDFAIDDLSFAAGCFSGSLGPAPNLGPDKSLCGGNSPLTLTSGIPYTTNLRYQWSTGATTPTISVNTPGTYALCVDSLLGGAAYTCKKSDIITITSNYSVDLGGPQTLCSPSTANLSIAFTGTGVTYLWSKNGSPIIPNITTSSLMVTSSGTYGVLVNDPVCGTQTSSVAITSNAATPIDQTRCFPGSATLSVAGSGIYRWYNTAGPNGGTVLGLGSSLTVTTAGTYYVQDTTTFAITAGPPLVGHGMTVHAGNPGSNPPSSSRLFFNVLQDMRLDTISMFYNNYYCAAGVIDRVGVDIINSSGVRVAGSPFIATIACSLQNNGGLPAPSIKIPIRANLLQGNSYVIQASTVSGLNSSLAFLNENSSGAPPAIRRYIFPTTYSNAITFVSNSLSNYSVYYKLDAYPGYFNWKITKGINCARVPVRAINFCPLSVYFLDISAELKSKSVVLHWRTTIPDRSLAYTIERSSDGVAFTSIGKLNQEYGENNSSDLTFTDANPLNGANYYRVSMKSNDGISYSSIVSINTEKELNVSVFPNPYSEKTTIRTYAKNQFLINYTLSDVSGKLVSNGTFNSNGETSIGEGLNSGVYVLVAETPDGKEFFRILKE